MQRAGPPRAASRAFRETPDKAEEEEEGKRIPPPLAARVAVRVDAVVAAARVVRVAGPASRY
jgi:hypothetical protein